jgi:hypothetical protein
MVQIVMLMRLHGQTMRSVRLRVYAVRLRLFRSRTVGLMRDRLATVSFSPLYGNCCWLCAWRRVSRQMGLEKETVCRTDG